MCKTKLGAGVMAGIVGAATIFAYKYEKDMKFRVAVNEKAGKAKDFVLDKIEKLK